LKRRPQSLAEEVAGISKGFCDLLKMTHFSSWPGLLSGHDELAESARFRWLYFEAGSQSLSVLTEI